MTDYETGLLLGKLQARIIELEARLEQYRPIAFGEREPEEGSEVLVYADWRWQLGEITDHDPMLNKRALLVGNSCYYEYSKMYWLPMPPTPEASR